MAPAPFYIDTSTVATRLTPPVTAAIATLAICGPDTLRLVERFVSLGRRPLALSAVRYGIWREAEKQADISHSSAAGQQVVVCRTGEETVEIHCHGGRAVCHALLGDLALAGCPTVSSSEFPSQLSCPLAQQAEQELLLATTDRAAAILLDQMNGSLRRAIQLILSSVVDRSADQMPRVVDRSADQGSSSPPPFSHPTSQSLSSPHPTSQPSPSLLIQQLLPWSQLGQHLSAPWKVVLVGPPNVGKSSLMNALVGTRQAIVHHEPGTTRDWIEASGAISGWPIAFTDTAGVRLASDGIEQAGVQRSSEQLRQADLALFVVDAAHGWTSVHDELLELAPSRRIVVWNKVDLATPGAPQPEFPLKGAAVVSTCAVDQRGIAQLLEAIVCSLVPAEPSEGAAIPFRAQHVEQLQQALQAIAQGQLSVAQAALQDMLHPTGKT